MDDFAVAFAAANEALSKLHLNDRKSQETAALHLSQQILSMAHEAPSEEIFAKSLNEINRRIFDLIHSNSAADRLGAILAINQIIDKADFDELQSNLARYANYLRVVLPAKDPTLMKEASGCLGKILGKGGPAVHEMVDFELNRIFQWLQDRSEINQLAACFVSEALLSNTLTVSNAYLSTLFDALWSLLRETKSMSIQDASSKAIKAALVSIKNKYDGNNLALFGQRTLSGLTEELKSASSTGSLTSALLVLGHLTDACSEVLNLENSVELFETLFGLLTHKSLSVRQIVFELVPALSAHVPKFFSERYLDRWTGVLVDTLKKEKERLMSLVAIASTANALGSEMKSCLAPISASLRTLLLSSSKSRSDEVWVFSVISSISEACKQDFFPSAQTLVPLILQQELTDGSVVAVVASMRGSPDLVAFIEDRIVISAQQELASGLPARVNLAIKLVTSTPFHFSFLNTKIARILLDIIDNLKYSAETRLLAANAIVSHCKYSHKPPVFCEPYQLVSRSLQKLLSSCLIDTDSSYVDSLVVLLNHSGFDVHWANSGAIEIFFALVSTGSMKTKLEVILLLKRLSNRLRSLIRPHLRVLLLQLSVRLKSKPRDDDVAKAGTIVEQLVQIDNVLMKPYVKLFLEILITHLDGTFEKLCLCSLNTLTQLVQIAPEDFSSCIYRLLDILSQMVQDLSSENLRLGGLRCLGTLLRNVDRDLIPTHRFVAMIQDIIVLLKIELIQDVRTEALRLLGIIGALDPYKMRRREIELASSDLKEGLQHGDDIYGIAEGSLLQEDQYPLVATNSLLKILKDPSMNAHHNASIQALVYIFRSVKVKAAAFLPQTLPVFLATIRSSSQTGGNLDFHFQSLAHIVSSVSLHIRPFVPEIVQFFHQYWDAEAAIQSSLLSVVESLVFALKGECREEVDTLMSPCINLLQASNRDNAHLLQKALRVISAFGSYLVPYIPTLIGNLVTISDCPDPMPADVNVGILKMLLRLIPEIDVFDQIPLILRIVTKSFESTDSRVKNSNLELIGLLLRLYEAFMRPQLPFIVRVADELHVGLSINQLSSLSESANREDVTSLAGYSALHANSTMLELDTTPADLVSFQTRKLVINEVNLRRTWEGFIHCTVKEDWFEWNRRFGLELIRESPSQSIRACSIIASTHYPVVKDLFNIAFLSCWTEFRPELQDELIGAIEEAFASQTVPAEVIQSFLNLAEFMEHEERPLPIDITTLGSYAIKCHAYAKALYYKELEFQANPSAATVEILISINSQIQLPDAASGVLAYAQKTYNIVLKESWYEKLQHWDDALTAYEKKWSEKPEEMDSLLGIFRCKHALGDWGGLNDLACSIWSKVPGEVQSTIAPWAAASAWGLGEWQLMKNFVSRIPEDTIDGSFFRSIVAVKEEDFGFFARQVLLTRERLDTELTTMINESYSRAYRTTVRVQMLAELEEVAEYKQSRNRLDRRVGIKDCWSKRLSDCQETVDVWQRMLKIRALVVDPAEEKDLWIKFSGLCRRMARPILSKKILLTLLGADDKTMEQLDLGKADPPVVYSLLEHYWDIGERDRALNFMRQYSRMLAHKLDLGLKLSPAEQAHLPYPVEEQTRLLSRCFIRLGKWQKVMCGEKNEDISDAVMECFLTATSYDKNSYKAWHGWALTNFEMAAVYEKQRPQEQRLRPNPYIVPAIQGFFRSISLSDGDGFQDSLRLLTLWFRYGSQPEVNAAVGDGFYTVPVDNWLQVIPQLIARIHVPSPQVRRLVHHVLTDIGRQHPQALLYPLTVASKSQSISRRTSALAILDKMKSHSARLVEQAVMVSQELIRVAITWEEMWYEALEEASKLYFGERNVTAMLQILEPLHQLLERGRETQREVAFYQAFGTILKNARDLCQRYKKSGVEDELKEAWDFYYQVFRKISKQLPQLTVLDLEGCSTKLLAAKDLDIPIPGSYRAGSPSIKIAGVAPAMSVIASKQRPRKLVFIGSDGQKYKFLLKGHEDLRQDERVMQLFGLVNSLLATDRETSKRHLGIQRFSVVPLSQNTGLIGWVPHCDTIHTLIRDYRESRGILLSSEHRLMLQFAPDYDHLTELQKVEVFEHAMTNTDGLDLNRVLWKKSKNAESWLERRTTFTRSLAVMSMVGYILGLGDRHPSNLMVDQVTGRVVHIDFGDCFEVAMHREKFPEKVPFRLTRMLIKAMEVSQIEGTFRIVSEHTMRVLRDNKDSVMAVLEAFVYDPLINWRLLTKPSAGPQRPVQTSPGVRNYSELLESDLSNFPENFSTRRTRLGTEISRLEDESMNRPEALNAGALNVINRVSNKLTGRDFNLDVPLDIVHQVDLLVEEATRIENLCQSYVGWCPFW